MPVDDVDALLLLVPYRGLVTRVVGASLGAIVAEETVTVEMTVVAVDIHKAVDPVEEMNPKEGGHGLRGGRNGW